jgi:CCR4-NOT transcriptional complex subunit CAF120
MNRHLFSCPSAQDLISWVAALRLSCWEKSRLEEVYTAHLIRINLNDAMNVASTLADGRLEGWVRVKVAGRTDWKRLWMCVSAGAIVDIAPISSRLSQIPGQNSRHSSYVTSKERGTSGLFSRDRSNDLPERASISFYNSPRGKDKKKPPLTFEAVTQAFAVYPEMPNLTSSGTLIKLEGMYGDERMCADMRHREGWMLLMPDSEGVGSGEMLRWLIGEHVPFAISL